MEKQATKICPYLGMKNDPTTPVGYPSTWNVCFRSKNQEIPKLKYQQSTCLSENFVNCSLYLSEDKISLPKSIRYQSNNFKELLQNRKFLMMVFLVLLIIPTILFFYRYGFPNLSEVLIPSWQKTQQVRTFQPLPTVPLTRVPDQNQMGSDNPAKTPTPTFEPTFTSTITLTPSTLALDTPIGGEIQFIIHRTLPGESLFIFARDYDTNVDAIRAVNYDLPTVLYVDRMIVIPIGIDEPAGLPTFEAFQVEMRGLTVETLSEELGVNPEDLSKFNNIPLDYKFTRGDWILVPRE